jgi:superoxide dismutase, Cu-Zn family
MRNLPIAAAAGALALLLAACNDTDDETPTGSGPPPPAEDEAPPADFGVEVRLHDADGEDIGHVMMIDLDDRVALTVRLHGVEPGFKGFHIHEVGVCDADDPDGPFESAGGHYSAGDDDHPDHDGDLPPLLVMNNGSVETTVVTDRFGLSDLTAGGAAIIVHEDHDNLAHVPERYNGEEHPDQDTLDTGDAGARLACGVIDDSPDGATPDDGETPGNGNTSDDATDDDAADHEAADR